MLDYNAITREGGAEGLLSPEVTQEIIQAVPEQSAALKLLRRLPNMSTGQKTLNILTQTPIAGFVNGDLGLKSTSDAEWQKKYITAEEIAVIIPVPEAVLADVNYDIWGEIKPQLSQAFGKVIDAAIFFGLNAPTPSWPDGIVADAITKNKTVVVGTGVDLADDVSAAMTLIEAQGLDVNGFAADVSIKSRLRGLRDLNQGLLFQPSLTADTPNTLYAQDLEFVKNGAWNPSTALLLTGDFTKAVYSIRQDITFKILDQAVISDADGKVLLNLAQQDAVALRVVMRLGWQIANPVTALSPDYDAAGHYPFSVIVPA